MWILQILREKTLYQWNMPRSILAAAVETITERVLGRRVLKNLVLVRALLVTTQSGSDTSTVLATGKLGPSAHRLVPSRGTRILEPRAKVRTKTLFRIPCL